MMTMFYNLSSDKHPEYRRCEVIGNNQGWITARFTRSGVTFQDWAYWFTGAIANEEGVL